MRPTDTAARPRYRLIDAIRGAAILNMIAYHLCYDIYCVYGVWPEFFLTTGAVIWERMICCTFILVSGVSMRFSHRGWQRGIIVNLCGFAITGLSLLFMPEQAIRFGILNLLGCGMLLTRALQKALDHIPAEVGCAASFILFMLCYGVPRRFIGIFDLSLLRLPDALYSTPFLAFLGFPSKSFTSSDYFPLLPWIFLFFCGWYLWKVILSRGWDRPLLRRVPVLDFIGRHSLLIYLLHQLVLLGVCRLIFGYI